ncbi:hypothetical protein M758_2G130300 [Ceratodon purpureus]|nr:hypothetical protein M758_2G130300 [Ceratodon purpureus]
MEAVGVNTRLDSGVALPSLGQLSSYHKRSSAGGERLKTCSLWTAKFTRRQVAPIQYKFAPLSNHRSVRIRAFSNDKDDWSSDDDNQWDPSYEIEVPSDQRPVNELAALKEATLYSWAQLSVVDFGIRLAGLWVFFFVLLGGPIAAASFEPTREPLKFFLAGGAGSLFAVSVLVLRMYLGWSYVGDRLLSAVVPYEETGWYDGQLYVKPPEILARDRLLGSYQVKPVMNRLKQTLVGAGALLASATVALVVLLPAQRDMDTVMYPPSRNGSEAIAAGSKPSSRKVDILNVPAEVMNDDDMAAAAAAAANGRPAYCTDRYYRALAGGQYCKWEDLRK